LHSSVAEVIRTRHGLGDCFYAYPVVMALVEKMLADAPKGAQVGVQTPWPQIYEDEPTVRTLACTSPLRTQQANLSANIPRMSPFPKQAHITTVQYDRQIDLIQNKTGTLLELTEWNAVIEAKPYEFRVPQRWRDLAAEDLDRIGLRIDEPFILAVYPTIRPEWNNRSRRPMLGLMAEMVKTVAGDLPILSVGWADPPYEWFVEAVRPATHLAEHGELCFETIVALTQAAHAVVSSVGYAIPVTLAVGGRLLSVFGGHVAPETLIDPRMAYPTETLPRRRVAVVAPDPFCHCVKNEHECVKDVDLDHARSIATEFREAIDAECP
jgi:hypothetical protein